MVPTPPPPGTPATHSIYVSNNSGFSKSLGFAGGTGTPADPYRIQDLVIEVHEQYGIWIMGTTAHFVISNVTVRDPSPSGDGYRSCCYMGIRLSTVENGTIQNARVEGTQGGIEIAYSEGIAVRDSMVTNANPGITLQGSTGVTLAGNRLVNSSLSLLPNSYASATRLTIGEDNTINGLPIYYQSECGAQTVAHRDLGALIVSGCNGFTAHDVTVGPWGLFAVMNSANIDLRTVGAPYMQFQNVTTIGLRDAQVQQMDVAAFEDFTLERSSTPVGSETAIRLENGTGTRIEHNDFRGIDIIRAGVHIAFWCPCMGAEPPVGVPRAIIANNTFADGIHYAVNLVDSEYAEVRDNTFTNHTNGVSFYQQRAVKVERNLFVGRGEGGTAISALGASGAVRNNTVSGFSIGVDAGPALEVVDNHLDATDQSLWLTDGGGPLAARNDMWTGGIVVGGQNLGTFQLGAGNTVNGLPVAFHSGCDGVTHDREALGQVIVVDCANVTLRNLSFANVSNPVILLGTQFFDVENLSTQDARTPLKLWSVWHGRVANSTFTGGADIPTYDALNVTFSENRFVGGNSSLSFEFVAGMELVNNTFEGPWVGTVSLSKAYEVTMRGNEFATGGLSVWGEEAQQFDSHDIDETNSVGDRPIVYLHGLEGATVTGKQAGQLIIAGCLNTTVRDVHAEGGAYPALVANSRGVRLDNVTTAGSWSGLMAINAVDLQVRGGAYDATSPEAQGAQAVYLGASDAQLLGTNVTADNGYGVYAYQSRVYINDSTVVGTVQAVEFNGGSTDGSSGGGIVRSKISGGWGAEFRRASNIEIRDSQFTGKGGVSLSTATGVVVAGNTFTDLEEGALGVREGQRVEIRNNTFTHSGVPLGGSAISISSGSANVTVAENRITGGAVGIWLETWGGGSIKPPGPVSIFNNTIEGNDLGIAGNSSAMVTVYHNRFLNNTVQARVSPRGAYDAGYLIGGNYWSDYAGVDVCTGPNQDQCTGPDAYGDTPYCLGPLDGQSEAADRYPLMTLVPPPARVPPPPPPRVADPSAAGIALPWLLLLLVIAAGAAIILGGARARRKSRTDAEAAAAEIAELADRPAP